MAGDKSVGEIAVIVGADVSALKIGMGKASGYMRGMEADSGKVAKKVAKNFALIGAAVAAAAGGMAIAVKKQLELIETLSDTAAKANTSTKALQELTFAATQNAATSKDVEDALTRLTQRMSQFANDGAGPAANAIKALGLSVLDADGNLRSSDAVFVDIIARFEQLGSSADKAALAGQLFGEKVGPRLMPLINQGAAGVEKLRAEANRLGLVFDEVGVRKAAAVNAKLRALSESISAKLTKAVVDNADEIEALVNVIVDDWIPAINKITAAFAPFFEALMTGIKLVGDLGRAWDAIAPELGFADNSPGARPPLPRPIPPSDPSTTGTWDLDPITGLPIIGSGRGGDPRQFGDVWSPQLWFGSRTPPKDPKDKSGGGGSGPTREDLEALQDALATEAELIQSNYERQLADLQEFRDAKLASEQEYNDLERRIKEQHEKDLASLERARREAALSGLQGMFGDLAGLMSSENEKLFSIGKAAATAQAVVSGYSAAVAAWEKGMKQPGGGPLLAAAYTAASLAKTGALIAGIQGANKGSTSQSIGGGGGTPSAPAAQTGAYYTINLQGDTFGTSGIRGIIEQINREVEGGAVIKGLRLA